MKHESVIVLKDFLKTEYIENPSMDSPDMSTAIRDLLTDLLHIGDKYGVEIESRLEDAQEVYEQEINSELSNRTGVTG